MRGRGFQASQTRAFFFSSALAVGFQIGKPGAKAQNYYVIASLQR